MLYKSYFFLLSVFFLSGCVFTPSYERPATVADDDIILKAGGNNIQNSLTDLFINEPYLLEMLEHAIRHNYDLKQASLRVDSVRAQKTGAILDFIPSANLTMTKNINMTQSLSLFTGETRKERVDVYQSSLGIDSYEVDIWGRKLNEVKALSHSEKHYLNALTALHLTLMADLASTWYETKSMIKLWHIYSETLTTFENINSKINVLLKANRLEPLIHSKFIQGKANIIYSAATLEKEIHKKINRMEYLSGFSSSYINHHKWKMITGDYTIPEIKQEIKTDVIFKRPDVISVEEKIKSVNGSIGAARAAFLPVVNIYANIYNTSNNFDNILSGLNDNWSLSPSVIIPVFNWPKHYNNLNYVMNQQKQAVVEYKNIVAQAMLDIKDATKSLVVYRDMLTTAGKEVTLHENNFSAMQKRYEAGYMDLYSYYELVNLTCIAKAEFESYRQKTMDSVIILLKSIGG